MYSFSSANQVVVFPRSAAWPAGRLALSARDFVCFHHLLEAQQINGDLFLWRFAQQLREDRAQFPRWRIVPEVNPDDRSPALWRPFKPDRTGIVHIRARK